MFNNKFLLIISSFHITIFAVLFGFWGEFLGFFFCPPLRLK
ncbi:MAG: hypothetical protein MRECE_3c048 [Mycoplasmataceae bacterium CE_OT135]|nr:MAG: hypothetical protein MRECE_3c048 [Mycoplasmataceae bacterium CE_OT135]